MSKLILATSGEYSDYQIEALLNVPSVDWLRERFVEYKNAKANLDRWTDTFDCIIGRSGLTKEKVLSSCADIVDTKVLETNGYVIYMDFDEWLYLHYSDDVSKPEYEILQLE